MGNITFQIKRFLQNKNTVTILGVLVIVLIIYFGYNWRVKQAINPIANIPYALVPIEPRTKITADKIGKMSVPPAYLNKNVIRNANEIVNKWSNYNTMIPAGSLFFKEVVKDITELPDYHLTEIPKNHILYYLPVNMQTTYGNSIFPGNYIDIYLKALNFDKKILVGKLIENVKVLAVKDSAGKNVFEDSSESRTPSMILFAVPENMHLLLRKANYLSGNRDIAAELILVPTNASYLGEVGAMKVTSEYLKLFIEYNTAEVEEDELDNVDEVEKKVEKEKQE